VKVTAAHAITLSARVATYLNVLEGGSRAASADHAATNTAKLPYAAMLVLLKLCRITQVFPAPATHQACTVPYTNATTAHK
jgi:hypothetical protein